MNTEIGKIKSLALCNFLTYDELRYIPGNGLNIIIGPNGTGKSTIVAGIILACGGKPALLSRSKDITDFVKNGKNKAKLEIELQKNEGSDVIVFHRSFDKTGKQSFKVDGTKATEKTYIERVKSFNIQVDNLCMFLPQDRVQDFTKLNSQELLRNTQNSVCSTEVNEAFETLIKKRELQKNASKNNDQLQTQLNDNINRNEQLFAVIESSRARDNLIQQRDLYLKKKAWMEYDELKVKFDEADNDVKKLQESINGKKKALLPFEKKQQEISGQKSALKNSISASITNIRQVQGQVDQIFNSMKNINSEIRQSKQKLKNAYENAKNHANNVQELQLKIQLDKNEHEKEKDLIENEEIDGKVRELDNKLTRHKSEIERYMKSIYSINSKLDNEITPAIEKSKRALNFMTDKQKQRIITLRNHFEDAHRAFEWLTENRNQFEGHVFNPIILEITTTELKYSQYLENTINMRDLQMFLCTNKNDVIKLTKILRSDMKLKVNIGFTEDTENLTFVSSRRINEFPREYGIYAHLIDIVDGPAPVLNYLCKLYNLHNVILADDRIERNASKLPDDIRLFFSSNTRFSVNVSRYANQKSLQSDNIFPRNLLHVSVNQEEVDNEQQILNNNVQRYNELKEKRTQLQNLIQMEEYECETIRTQKNEIMKKIRKVKAMGERIRAREIELEKLKSRKVDIHDLRKTHKNDNDELVKKFLKSAENVEKALKEYNNALKTREMAKKKLQIFDDSTGNVDQKIIDLQREINLVSDTLNRARVVHENLKHRLEVKSKEALELTHNIRPSAPNFPYTSKFAKLPNKIVELQDKIDEMQGRIECIRGVDPKIVEEYEQRKIAIEELKNNLSQVQQNTDKLENEMQTLHNQWYPEIVRIVSSINMNFSKFFAKMGFIGEVELIRQAERDYADYGIQIRVQYRNNEKLQALNRHVQSGGERAVAIAVYTLSLQHLTMVPFRCVDEINQGMDPNNERKIFQMLVDITCQEGQSQYFFVTPKLLPNLPFNDLMTITVVYNGKYIEDPFIFEDNEEQSIMEVDE